MAGMHRYTRAGILVLLALCWGVAGAGAAGEKSANQAAPADAALQPSEPAEAGYESPPVLRAADLLPDYLLSGPVFTVNPEVRNDGETNHYTVQSPLGDVEAAGRDELEQVIQELRAAAYLRQYKKRTGAIVGFNQGMKKVITAPYHKVKGVVFNPLYAIEAVPTEIADYASRIAAISDLFKYGPRVFIRRSLGIEGARDELADRLHVDDKTDNAVLREEIKRVGWGVWAGGLVPDIGEGYIDLGYDLSTEVGDLGEGNLGRAVKELRREVFPRHARHMLRKMDVPKDLIQEFRQHPNFPGRQREGVAEALLTMEETAGREAYVAWAMTVESEREARRVAQLARVLAVYHDREAPVSRIHHRDDVLLVDLANDGVATPLIHDYLIWSEAAAGDIELAIAMKNETAPDAAMDIWSLGEFSPRMRRELDERGYGVRANIDETLPPFQRPRKGLKRLEQRYERRVEDPVKEKFREEYFPASNQRLVLEPLGPDNPGTAEVPVPDAAALEAGDRERTRPAMKAQRRIERHRSHSAGYPTREHLRKRLNLDGNP